MQKCLPQSVEAYLHKNRTALKKESCFVKMQPQQASDDQSIGGLYLLIKYKVH